MVKKKKGSDGGINERVRKQSKAKRKKMRERDRSVCRLLQSHCTTLEFQTRTLGRADQSRAEQSREQRAEERRGEGAKADGRARGGATSKHWRLTGGR